MTNLTNQILLDAIRDGFAIFDATQALVIWNKTVQKQIPIAPDYWDIGTSFEAIWKAFLKQNGISANEAARNAQSLSDMISNKTNHQIDFKTRDGIFYQLRSTKLKEGLYLINFRDITSAKNLETRLGDRIIAIDKAYDVICILHQDGHLNYANQAFYEIFEPALRNLTAESFSNNSDIVFHKLFDANLQEQITDIIHDKLKHSGFWRSILSGKDAAGEDIYFDSSFSKTEQDSIVIVLRDDRAERNAMIKQKRLEEQLKKSQSQEAMGHLTAGIAHDFNNLLSAISGSAMLIRLNETRNEEIDRDLDRIDKAVEQAGALIGRLLDFGARERHRKYQELGEAISETAELVDSSLPKTIDFTKKISTKAFKTYFDPNDITQLLLNLLINARDAMPLKGGKILLEFEPDPRQIPQAPRIGIFEAQKEYAEIIVSDTGKGIDSEIINQLFDAYFTTKGEAGTGLGLSVVKNIVEANNALLDIETMTDIGTSFRIYWPKTEPIQRVTEKEKHKGLLDGALILVVDDMEDIGDYVANILEKEGAEVAATTESREGLEFALDSDVNWSLIILDENMPDIKGSEIAQNIRKNGLRIPLLLVSGLLKYNIISEENLNLFDAHLEKPFGEEALVDIVIKLIARTKEEETTT